MAVRNLSGTTKNQNRKESNKKQNNNKNHNMKTKTKNQNRKESNKKQNNNKNHNMKTKTRISKKKGEISIDFLWVKKRFLQKNPHAETTTFFFQFLRLLRSYVSSIFFVTNSVRLEELARLHTSLLSNSSFPTNFLNKNLCLKRETFLSRDYIS